jgi:CheY-like chemotaxis protein
MTKRVLLVGNNVPTIDVMQMELKHLGYEVRIAQNGLEPVKLAVANPLT